MAKRKSRRPNVPEQTLARAREELYKEGGKPVPANANSPAAHAKPKPSTGMRAVSKVTAVSIDDLRVEYAYVLNDLKSMMILAGFLIAGLIVATYIAK